MDELQKNKNFQTIVKWQVMKTVAVPVNQLNFADPCADKDFCTYPIYYPMQTS